MCARTNKRPNRRRRNARPASDYYKQPLPVEPPSPGGADFSSADLPADLLTLILSRVAETLKGSPGDLPLILRSADSLVRTLTAEHRLSGKEEKDLGERITRVLTHLSSQLGVEPTILPPDAPPGGSVNEWVTD